MTRLTLETEVGKFIVEVAAEGLSLGKVLADVVAPVLMAAGYHDQQVRELLFLDV